MPAAVRVRPGARPGEIGVHGGILPLTGGQALGVAQQRGEEVAELGDPPGHVGGGEHQVLGTGGRAHLVPRDGGGDGRPGPAAQRVARDRGLVRVVLAPVHEHPPAAAGLRHHGGDEPRRLGGQLLGERLGVRRRALGRADRDRQVELHALAAAGAGPAGRVRRRRGVRPGARPPARSRPPWCPRRGRGRRPRGRGCGARRAARPSTAARAAPARPGWPPTPGPARSR